MGDTALKEAYQRINYALTCDGRELYQEAYRNYLATTTYITNVLGLRSAGEVWCDENTLKLLDLAKMCVEAAARINATVIKRQQELTPSNSATDNAISSTTPAGPSSPPLPLPTENASLEEVMNQEDPDDILSILDSLPDVPANRPGQKYKPPIKRSATLPVLPKAGSDDKTNLSSTSGTNLGAPRNNPAVSKYQQHTLPTRSRSVYIPPPPAPVRNDTTYFSSPIGTNLGGTQNNPVVLKVGPMERAKQQNTFLAAKYERRAQRGMLRPRDRLELIRAQEENLMIARELEKTLNKKSEQRKQRLELEQAEQSVESSMGSFEAVLYCNMEQITKLLAEAKDYDIQFRTWPSTEEEEGETNKMQHILAWCFGESSHPMNKAVGEAQFNFYNRLAPLSKKMYLATAEEREALMPGIEAELEAITGDITVYLKHLTAVFIKLYPMFNCETGEMILQTKLNDLFFKPFLQLLIELYSFVLSESLTLLKAHLAEHAGDDITMYSDIKKKYHLGEDPYRPAISALLEITETSSPLKKLALLVNFGQLISSSVKDHYLEKGSSQEEAVDVSCMGADDMMPLAVYVITRANQPELLTELQVLFDITPEDDLMGSEGYCLTTVQYAIGCIIEQGRAGTPQDRESDL